jgi:hypothetical protein
MPISGQQVFSGDKIFPKICFFPLTQRSKIDFHQTDQIEKGNSKSIFKMYEYIFFCPKFT